MIEIINYDKKYNEKIKDLLVELQKYLVNIDDLKTQIIIPEYREQYFDLIRKSVKDNTGKILLAKMDNQIVGLIVGIIEEKDTIDQLTNTCPKRGIISELVVSKSQEEKILAKN